MDATTQKHVIKKQVLEFELSEQHKAFEFQNEVSKIYQNKVIPMIDALCSDLSSDIHYKIDTLEIDIGDININNWVQEFLEKVAVQLQQKLAEKISHSRAQEFSIDVGEENTTNNFDQLLDTTSNETHSQLELFSYFLQTGTLPWWAPKLSKQELEAQFDELINSSANAVQAIIEQCFTEEKCLKRLIYQFTDKTLIKIIQILSPNLYQFISNYDTDIQAIFNLDISVLKHISISQLRLKHWQGIFIAQSTGVNTSDNEFQLTKQILLNLAKSLDVSYHTLIEQISQAANNLNSQGFNFNRKLPEILTHINQTISKQILEESLPSTHPDINSNAPISFPDSQNYENLSPNPSPARRGELIYSPFPTREGGRGVRFDISSPHNDSEEIYIDNAGLILLHPFINRFFETIGIAQHGNFTNSSVCHKAVLLLQFLVDGSTESSEHFLPLNKLLCGIDLFEPIESILDITAEEQEEAENVLSAVIQNWSVLKNTSIDGFRNAFLQREAILRSRDGSWLLQVEQQTHDILLDKIPWSFRVVKLPWMDEVLYVEW